PGGSALPARTRLLRGRRPRCSAAGSAARTRDRAQLRTRPAVAAAHPRRRHQSVKAAVLALLAAASVAAAAVGPRTGVRARPADAAAARSAFPALDAAVEEAVARQEFPVIPLDGRFVMARIYFEAGGGGFGGFRRRGFGGDPPWHHDYPYAEQNFTQILRELTYVNPYTEGGNVFPLDDPKLTNYPIAYMSEPGFWVPTDEEAAALR